MQVFDLIRFPDKVILRVDQIFLKIRCIGKHFVPVSLITASKKITAIQVFKINEPFKNVFVLFHIQLLPRVALNSRKRFTQLIISTPAHRQAKGADPLYPCSDCIPWAYNI